VISEVLARHEAHVLAALGAIGTPHMQQRTVAIAGGLGCTTSIFEAF
jgi:hypothetical protein